MLEELRKTRIYINTPLNKTENTGIPLMNLDWGSTNLPINKIDQAVAERTWAIHGNPGSCGSYTGGLTRTMIVDTTRSILKHLNVEGDVHYGGYGASYWLGRLPEVLNTSRLLLIQTEIHDAMVGKWKHIDRYNPDVSDRCTWVRRMCMKHGSGNLVLGISLSSHLTGATFEDKWGVLDFCRDMGVRVLIDATCYLAHHRVPEIPHFDYLVFSPHKLPGGPGSCGVLVTGRGVEWAAEPGSQNVPGIFRIRDVLEEFRKIEEPEGVDGRIQQFISSFGSLKEGCFSVKMMFWDDAKIEEPHFSFKIMWKSPDSHCLQVHPSLVSMICTHVYGIQIRGGGICAESFLTNRNVGLMKPGVCRISVPRYLFTQELSDLVLERFRDMLKYMNYYIRCYHIDETHNWNVSPEIVLRRPDPASQGKKTCCMGSNLTYHTFLKKDELLRGGMMVIDWMFPEVWTKIMSRRHTDVYLEDPERWFLHPEDLRNTDPEI